jgi:sec-independent protein translocase protein TatB
MFDMGFWELMVIGILGLVVLGPERLPVAIRTVKGWMTTARKLTDSVKREITEELRINELHSHLKKAEQLDMSNLSPELAKSVQSLKDAAAEVTRPYGNSANTAANTSPDTLPENLPEHSNHHSVNRSDDSENSDQHTPAQVVFDGQVEQHDDITLPTVDQAIDSSTPSAKIKIEDKHTHE